MGEFLKLNLDGYSKSATIRLSDDDESILQAQFDKDDVVIHRLNFERKPKHFEMTHAEASAFAAAWTDYQQRVQQHVTEAETRLQTAIEDAKKLAASVHFDLDTLNIKMERDDGDASWLIEVKAIAHHRWVYEHNCQELVSTVQEVLDYIKEQVEYAEKHSWDSHEWRQIIPSYRRVFPLESAEITEARELLKNSLHPTDWAVCAMYPGTSTDCWSFDNGLDGDKHYAMLNHPASKILEFVKMYLAEEQAPATTGD